MNDAQHLRARRVEMALLEVGYDVRGLARPAPTTKNGIQIRSGVVPKPILWRAFALSAMSAKRLTSCLACFERWPRTVERQQHCVDRRLGPVVLDCGTERNDRP